MILKITRKSCKHLAVQISRKEIIPYSHGTRSDNLCSQTIALFGNYVFIQFAKLAKSGNYIVIFNGNVLGRV